MAADSSKLRRVIWRETGKGQERSGKTFYCWTALHVHKREQIGAELTIDIAQRQKPRRQRCLTVRDAETSER